MTEQQKEQLHNDILEFIQDGDIESMEELIAEGASVHENYSEFLRTAVDLENLKIVKLLVTKYKVNVNVMDGAPLRRAVELGNKKIAKVLLQNKANPNLKPKVLSVKQNNEEEIIPKRRKKRIYFDDPKLVIPTLAIAVRNEDLEMVQLLIDHGADVSENNHCVLQCVASPEMLVLLGKHMSVNSLDVQKGQVGLTQNLSIESLKNLDTAMEKVKFIHKMEAL